MTFQQIWSDYTDADKKALAKLVGKKVDYLKNVANGSDTPGLPLAKDLRWHCQHVGKGRRPTLKSLRPDFWG